MEENANINILIIRFLDGSITPSEKEILYAWISESEENKKDFLNLYRTWNLNQASTLDFEDEKAYQEVWAKIKREEPARRKHRFPLRVLLVTATTAAAIILLLIILKPFTEVYEGPDISSFFERNNLFSG
ncbi:MAG: hypothetical protein LIP01_06455 [Tannerellaceae bacterium]|nr:hypothetical protein [Tannerellaceae bacterium]